uniref:uncharacterized protein LOC105349480 n=1 Tax=Fragaria vesca subsp. vesca TaxID=101020 RepID=UPI0005CA353D|nr:PREDICTED: uncharacterized protein LOC105349480 [Fragaria vesca subsp. vesca]
MQRDDSLKSYDKLVVEKWMQLLRLQGARLERMTKRDSRTAQATFRNWDWSDPRSAYCLFDRVSKLKWFVPFINQGNSAEIQLPPNVFDNHNWLGFAVCVQCSRSSSSSEDVVLAYRLDSDVAWHGLFDYKMRAVMKLPETPKDELYDATMFVYIPRTKALMSKMWRQCKLARITVWFSNPCAAIVHTCALRLLFKDDIEHLVETLTVASDENRYFLGLTAV